MIKRHCVPIRMAILLTAIMVFLAPSASVRAGTGGNEDIGGTVYSVRFLYRTHRTIASPTSSGPDIAAIKYIGPSTMKLGAHDCYGTYLGVGQTLSTSYYQGLVGDMTTYPGQDFCLFPEPGSSGSTGTFSGNLDWD